MHDAWVTAAEQIHSHAGDSSSADKKIYITLSPFILSFGSAENLK
jgi:hypothetical protein